MDSKKRLILSSIVALAFVGVLFFVIFIGEEKDKSSDFSQKNQLSDRQSDKKEELQPKILPLIPIEKNSSSDSVFGQVSDFIDQGLNLIKKDLLPQNQDKTNKGGETQAETTKQLSEEEIFDRIWPKEYKDYLGMLEGVMIDDGFLDAGEKQDVIDSDEKVYAILLKMIDYAESKQWLVTADAARLREGVSVFLPETILKERQGLKNGHVSSEHVLPRDQNVSNVWYGKEFFVQDLIDGLKFVFSVSTASANPGWVTSPDCYKDDNPFYPVPGFNGLTFCCDCGLKIACSSTGVCFCVYEEHCGPSGCNCFNFGCLNGQCGWPAGPAIGPELWPNAIWDPVTGICGCG